jgi:hypothetical protein
MRPKRVAQRIAGRRKISVQYKFHPTFREMLEDIACALNKARGQVLEELIEKFDAELRSQLSDKDLRAYRDRKFDFTEFALRSRHEVRSAA